MYCERNSTSFLPFTLRGEAVAIGLAAGGGIFCFEAAMKVKDVVTTPLHLSEKERKEYAGFTGFKKAMLGGLDGLITAYGANVSDVVDYITVVTKDGYAIRICNIEAADLRLGNFDLVKDGELAEWGAHRMMERFISNWAERKAENNRRVIALNLLVMMGDELLIRAGITKRKARAQWMARTFGTTAENVHQELNKIYKRGRKKRVPKVVMTNRDADKVRKVTGDIKTALLRGEIDEEGAKKKR
jgi:hypothetical protein